MANKIDRLFETVLASLMKESNVESELDSPWDDSNFNEPFNDSDDRVQTLDEANRRNAIFDRYSGDPDYRGLDLAERDAAEAGIRCRGFDVLAFYKSRRHIDKGPYKGKWGIFYLEQGLQFVAEQIAQEHPGYGAPSMLAYEFLRAHEWFHYRADLQTLMLEATTEEHLHVLRRHLFRGREHLLVEEALANRHAWEWAKQAKIGLGGFAFDFMKLQPGEYARFDDDRMQLAAEWASQALDVAGPRYDLAHWVEASPAGLMHKSLCPEYMVSPAKLGTWWPAAYIPLPLTSITDDDAVTKYLGKIKDRSLANKWQTTKERLLANRFANGLDFKPWADDPPAWSVKVNDGDRAHLKPEGDGIWRAYKIGPHDYMGHGK